MLNMAALPRDSADLDISYGIYTIERLPKGSKRTPKWDLHSTAKDRETAETHAKILAAQPYFDQIEVQEFRICPETKDRTVQKIRSYSRQSPRWIFSTLIVLSFLVIFFLMYY